MGDAGGADAGGVAILYRQPWAPCRESAEDADMARQSRLYGRGRFSFFGGGGGIPPMRTPKARKKWKVFSFAEGVQYLSMTFLISLITPHIGAFDVAEHNYIYLFTYYLLIYYRNRTWW